MSTPSIDVVNIISPPGWMADAACAEADPEWFYPDKGGSARAGKGKQVCAGCPVRAQCLAYALAHGERFGIWGGESERERRALARAGQDPRAQTGPPVGGRVGEVRRLTAAGLSDRQVADRIGCTTRTVQRLRARFALPASGMRGVA